MSEPDEIIARLRLAPHPEGGWFRETWRAALPPDAPPGTRAAGTAIYFLLRAGEVSHWHRIDSAEIWLWHAGSALALRLSPDGQAAETHLLGPDLAAGEEPQRLVPPGFWQAAEPCGGWVLVSCTVAPGFDFARFELAPPGWQPGSGNAPDSRD